MLVGVGGAVAAGAGDAGLDVLGGECLGLEVEVANEAGPVVGDVERDVGRRAGGHGRVHGGRVVVILGQGPGIQDAYFKRNRSYAARSASCVRNATKTTKASCQTAAIP